MTMFRQQEACYCSSSFKEVIVVSVSVIVRRFNFLKHSGLEFYLGCYFSSCLVLTHEQAKVAYKSNMFSLFISFYNTTLPFYHFSLSTLSLYHPATLLVWLYRSWSCVSTFIHTQCIWKGLEMGGHTYVIPYLLLQLKTPSLYGGYIILCIPLV